jgi:hypothetical protein
MRVPVVGFRKVALQLGLKMGLVERRMIAAQSRRKSAE